MTNFSGFNEFSTDTLLRDIYVKTTEKALITQILTNRVSDFAFRLGGEEFGIITALDKDKALDFANTIKEKIEDLQIEHNASEVSSYITISIGITSRKGFDITNSDAMYKEADDALYEAKNLGRNCIFMQ